jgi:hypothetical protein
MLQWPMGISLQKLDLPNHLAEVLGILRGFCWRRRGHEYNGR